MKTDDKTLNMLDLRIVGQGATSKIYRDGDTAVKVYESASLGQVENEAARQRFAFDAGLPVPAVFGVRKLEGNAVALDMAYIDGQPLMRLGMDKEERKAAVLSLVKLQRKVHAVNANGQPKQTELLAWKIRHTGYLDAPRVDRLLLLLNRLDTGGTNLCHGDFHPLNILNDGGKHWLIDWVDATAGNTLADACRTYVIFKQFITRMSGVYLRAFCDETGARKEDVLAWFPVAAAARLADNPGDTRNAGLLHSIEDWYASNR